MQSLGKTASGKTMYRCESCGRIYSENELTIDPVETIEADNDIDIELLPLIRELNAVGIKTLACCSGHGETCAYILIDMDSLQSVEVMQGMLVIDWRLYGKPAKRRWERIKIGGTNAKPE